MAPVDPLAFFSQTGPDGVSVRSHLTEVIHKLLLSKDPDALQKLESISLEVKAKHFDANQPGSKEKPELPAGSVTAVNGAVVPTEGLLKLAKALQTSTDPEVTPASYVSELPDQMPMFSWAGVGLSKEETYRIYLAMLKLGKEKELPAVRFFGKIFGTKADYIIVEASGNKEAHKAPSGVAEGATPAEEPGVGLNACTYFVSSSACEEFVQLEDVTPDQVLKSMAIRKYFTGNLDAPVACYPAFPGPEAAYLRAQIARIAQATAVQPAGKLMVDDESEQTYPKPIKESPEYAVPEGLPDLASWVHTYQGILKIGRCTNVPWTPPEGDEEAEPPEVEEETEPLVAIAEDAPVVQFDEENALGAWAAKMYHAEFDAYSVAIAKSIRWPGAYAALAKSGDKAASVYFGTGHEATGKAFTPQAPPPVLPESQETEEAPEVELAAENALLKEIDEAKLAAANAEGEPADE